MSETSDGRELSPYNEHTPQEEHGALIGYSGPLPPASEFLRYEQVLPGAADRILTVSETQAKHRQQMEVQIVSSDLRGAQRGTVLAFLIVLAGLGGGVFLAFHDKLGGAFASILLPLATVAGVFVYQQRSKKE